MEDQLPFKYLGIRVIAKKLSVEDCHCLTDKIVARIRTWGTRSLSYAGRAQLVNYVLITLHSYWSSIFVLPKKVLDSVSAICRNYLWDGRAIYTRAPPIAWEIVCRRKGIHDCYKQNIATMGKYIWNIANQNESLWLRWVNHVYLKGKT